MPLTDRDDAELLGIAERIGRRYEAKRTREEAVEAERRGWCSRTYTAVAAVSLTLWIVLLALAALMLLPGCYNADELGRIERAREQAQLERQVATEQFQRGEIGADAYRNLLDQADEVEQAAREQASSDASSRWVESMFDPQALVRELLLGGLGLFALNKHRNRTRSKVLAGKGGGT